MTDQEGEPTNASGRSSVVARLTAELRHDILTGVLRPGERIRQEEIGLRAGVSRIPAREALRRLEGEGLVTLTPHAGARVARLDPAELHEIYLIREHLEPLALLESVPYLTVAQLGTLTEMHASMESLTAATEIDVAAFLEVDRDFHLLLTSGGPMARLHRLVREMINAAQPYRRAVSFVDRQRTLATTNDEHRQLLEAVRHNRADHAATILRDHIRATRRTLAGSLDGS